MLEHLRNPEYVHTLLNPLPIYGLGVGVFALLIALISRARAARLTALSIIFLCAISAWPVYHYGEAAESRVLPLADADGAKWLHEHEERAEKLIYLFYLLAAVSAIAVAAELRALRAAIPLRVLALVLAVAAVAAGGYIAHAGGRIRHREFRYEPPPAAAAKEGIEQKDGSRD